jgi:pyruvate,water dikinase
MFAVNDDEMREAGHAAKEIKTEVPLNLYVLDLGGGLAPDSDDARRIDPERILSKPFRSLWRGANHPGVSWRRDLPASFGDVASVVASSFMPKGSETREVGLRSYVLVADEYMNLNSRLAYHFNLVDARLCDDPVQNYVSFRFAGGGATRYRRNLRACFVEDCLKHYGFIVHRRGDLLNAWLRNAPAEVIDHSLDILGRLLACTSQLDMYMANRETMRWFVEQFLAGNYEFKVSEDEPRTTTD